MLALGRLFGLVGEEARYIQYNVFWFGSTAYKLKLREDRCGGIFPLKHIYIYQLTDIDNT